MPKTTDVVIFVPTTTTMKELQTDHFTPCAYAWANDRPYELARLTVINFTTYMYAIPIFHKDINLRDCANNPRQDHDVTVDVEQGGIQGGEGHTLGSPPPPKKNFFFQV